MDVEPKNIVSDTPSDTEHPKLYENTAFILGFIIALAVLVVGILAFCGKTNDAVTTGVVGIAMVCAGALARMFEPRKAG